MANAVLWDARPSGETLIASTGTLRNLANDANAVSSECTNGTGLYTHADFLLYAHDFTSAPTSGGYFELHVVYEMDSTFADGEDGDLAGTPNLTGNTLVGLFPIKASDEDQYIQLTQIPIGPHDFKCVVVNRTGVGIADSDGSLLKIYRYSLELQ